MKTRKILKWLSAAIVFGLLCALFAVAASAAEVTIVNGDVNGDGKVSVADVVLLRKYIANKDYDETETETETEMIEHDHYSDGVYYDNGDGTHCTFCAFVDENGTACDEILEVADHVKTSATYNDADQLYHFDCSVCGAADIETAPFNLYVDAEALAEQAEKRGGMVTVELAEDGSSVKIYCNSNHEVYFEPFVGNTSETGQYLMIKYRTNYTIYWEVFTSTIYDHAQSMQDYVGGIIPSADESWNLLILDLTKSQTFTANDVGEYVAKYLRFDIFNGLSGVETNPYVELGFIAVCEDLEAITAYLNGDGDVACPHSFTKVVAEGDNMCDVVCLICQEVIGDAHERIIATEGENMCDEVCAVCGDVLAEDVHIEGEIITEEGENQCKTLCTICGVVLNDAAHSEEIILEDTEDHKKCDVVCAICGITLREEDHAYEASEVEDDDSVIYKSECSVCGNVAYEYTVANDVIFFDATDLNGKDISVGDKVAKTLSKDYSYVRFERKGIEFCDGNIMLLNGNTQVTGQYVVIKYRTDHSTSGNFWVNTQANGHDNGKATFSFAFSNDEQWHIIVYDLAAKKPAYVQPNADGDYIIQWSRFDILDRTASTGYIDLGWIMFCSDLADAKGVIGEAGQEICQHNVTYVTNACEKLCSACGYSFGTFHDYEASFVDVAGTRTYTYDCKNCTEATYTKSYTVGDGIKKFINVADIYTMKGGSVGTRSYGDEAAYTRVMMTPGAGECYFNVLSGNTDVTGKYFVVKFRTNYNGYMQVYTSTTDEGAAAANGVEILNPNHGFNDEQWHLMVFDMSVIGSFADSADAAAKFLRWDYFNNAALADSTYIDIEYIVFANDMEDVAALAGSDLANICIHHTKTKSFVTVEDHNYATEADVCATCGVTVGTATKSPIFGYISNLCGKSTGRSPAVGSAVVDATTLGVTSADTAFVSGWTLISSDFDAGVYRVLKADGTVLKDWTVATRTEYQQTPNDATAMQNACPASAGIIEDWPHRIGLSADISEFYGQTVTVEFALVAKAAPEGNQYVQLALISNIAAVCNHKSANYTFITDNDDKTTTAIRQGACTVCGENTEVKEVPFIAGLQEVIGAQTYADGSAAVSYGQNFFEFKSGTKFYPAEGNVAPDASGYFTVIGWAGTIGGISGIQYQVTDAATGEVLQAWTADTVGSVSKSLDPGVHSAVKADLGEAEDGYTFVAKADLTAANLAGKTVNITYALVATQGVGNDVLVPFAAAINVDVPTVE